jgi:hypothetical protein
MSENSPNLVTLMLTPLSTCFGFQGSSSICIMYPSSNKISMLLYFGFHGGYLNFLDLNFLARR